jgi:Na+-translocating ferredoxin:NAD+ oxidoreductase RnfC subunit
MSTVKGAMGRARPEDGGVVWHERYNAFECLGCGECEAVGNRARRTPERLAELRELLVMDHGECWEFADARMAAEARRYRKEKKRRQLLGTRG